MSKILSICMMVKNEDKNLERCLESLRELRMKLPCELIIVDTGSEDNTVSIAKRYTDKVYHHPWNNNFSEMRNISISYASGEWLFIIDADEELVAAEKLIQFFKKSYPKSIAGGALLVKNLTGNKVNKNVVVLNSSRVFRNDGAFHYEGSVHNMPIINGQILEIQASINHYGYDSTDQELMEQKFVRTSTILKRELAKNPDNIYYRFQLSVTYMMHKENNHALEEIEKAYRLMKKASDKKKHLYVYCQLARSYMKMSQYQKVEETCLEGIAIEEEYIDLYFYMAQAQGTHEKYEQAIENYSQYMKLVENFDNLAIKLNPVINHYTLPHMDEALYNVSVMLFKTDRFEQALNNVEELIKDNDSDVNLIVRAIPILVDACFTTQNFIRLRDILLGDLQARGLTLVEQALQRIEQDRKKLDKIVEKNFFQVFASFGDKYGILNKIRIMNNTGDTELADAISKFSNANDFNSLPDYYGDLIYNLIRLGRPEEVLGNLTELNAVRYLKYLSDEYGATVNDAILLYCGEDLESDFKKLRSKKMLLKYVLFSEECSDESYLSTFQKYLTSGTTYMQKIYTPLVLDQELIHDVKSVEEAFLLYMLNARSYKHGESGYVQYLKKAVTIFPEMNKGIKLLLQEIEEPANNAAKEMTDLRGELIQHIQTLLDTGEYASAKNILEEYEQICGADADSLTLKSQAMLH
ncbi:glycosyltransferase [Desulfosporosinus fructosivorans]|nr:glycosyltransferase [Desulfosporosinus fructosivorans]